MKVRKTKEKYSNSTNMALLVESATQEEILEYDKNRIVKSLELEIDCPHDTAVEVADVVTEKLLNTGTTILTPALIRSFVNVVLCERGLKVQLQSDSEITISTNEIEGLIKYKSKDNGNTPHNPESINLNIAGNIIKQYVLKKVLPRELVTAHLSGDIHIHDMDMYNRLYCSGHNLEYIKRYGIQNMENIPNDSKPAGSAWVAARHMASATLFFTSLFSGAVGWDSVNIFLAPYTRGWDEKKYKQLAQTLIFDFAQLAGAKGGQVSFTDFNIYANIPSFYKNTYAVGKNGCYMFQPNNNDEIVYIYDRDEMNTYAANHTGKILRYSDFEKESQSICKGLLEVTIDGDCRHMPFGFPKIHFHINDEVFAHEESKKLYSLACVALSKQGNPYIDFDRNAASMSQCCRLTIAFDNNDMKLTETPEELRFVGGENVSINLPNLSLQTKNEDEIYAELKRRMDLAAEAHILKKEYVLEIANQKNSSLAFYLHGCDGKPYVKFDKISWLIGIVGLNEYVYNLIGKQLHESKQAYLKGLELITYMNSYCKELSEKYKMTFKLEETPAESTAGRFAKLDIKRYGDKVFSKGDGDGVYYTNSIHFAVDAKIDYIDELQYQSKFHSLVEAGSMVHVWVGDKSPSSQALSTLIYNVWMNTKCTEMTISPNKTICNDCKITIDGFHDFCPKCHSENVFWIARITGYQVRVDKFNASKLAELKDRNNHDIENDSNFEEFLINDITHSGITIYTKTNCPNCKKIKNFCLQNNINFEERNIDTDFKAKARLILENKMMLPVIEINNNIIEYSSCNHDDITKVLLNNV